MLLLLLLMLSMLLLLTETVVAEVAEVAEVAAAMMMATKQETMRTTARRPVAALPKTAMWTPCM
jgi:hypothetical protein